MAKKRGEPRKYAIPTSFEQARDELFSHILRCGVLEATPEHQKEWFDDTLLYLADRFTDLTETELNDLPFRSGRPRRRRRLTAEVSGKEGRPRTAPFVFSTSTKRGTFAVAIRRQREHRPPGPAPHTSCSGVRAPPRVPEEQPANLCRATRDGRCRQLLIPQPAPFLFAPWDSRRAGALAGRAPPPGRRRCRPRTPPRYASRCPDAARCRARRRRRCGAPSRPRRRRSAP